MIPIDSGLFINYEAVVSLVTQCEAQGSAQRLEFFGWGL